jgi:hypothetical protein
MSPQEIEAAEALCGKASAECRLPWIATTTGLPMVWDDSGDAIVNRKGDAPYFEPEIADFIAAASALLPAALADLKRARERITELEGALKGIESFAGGSRFESGYFIADKVREMVRAALSAGKE